MHLLIPFASGLSPAAVHAAGVVSLPTLAQLLSRLHPDPEPGPTPGPDSFSPPHERALAQALGWAGGDGQLPLAAWRAAADGLLVADLAWGELTPAHWHAGRDQVTLADPASLGLDADASREIFEAVRGLFEDEGFVFAWAAPLRWYIAHPSLAGLRTASPDRVIGRNIDPFLPYDAGARTLRRLQQEVQMLLYQHPQHDARETAGLLPVNSFWLSGCGRAQDTRGVAPTVVDDLRPAALAADWTAWAEGWQRMDAGPLAEGLERVRRGQPFRLTLCGERTSVSLSRPRGWLARGSLALRDGADTARLLQGL